MGGSSNQRLCATVAQLVGMDSSMSLLLSWSRGIASHHPRDDPPSTKHMNKHFNIRGRTEDALTATTTPRNDPPPALPRAVPSPQGWRQLQRHNCQDAKHKDKDPGHPDKGHEDCRWCPCHTLADGTKVVKEVCAPTVYSHGAEGDGTVCGDERGRIRAPTVFEDGACTRKYRGFYGGFKSDDVQACRAWRAADS